MFGRNKKKVEKLKKIVKTDVIFDEGSRIFTFDAHTLDEDQIKKIHKLGLKIRFVTHHKDTTIINLDHKSNLPAFIIGLLSMQVILFGLQVLWLASKTNPP